MIDARNPTADKATGLLPVRKCRQKNSSSIRDKQEVFSVTHQYS